MSRPALLAGRGCHALVVDAPPPHVLAAFGVSATALALPGGQGGTWAAAAAVLKPVDDPAEGAEVADLVARLPDDDRYRVARPIRAADGRWIVDGWSAWTKLKGHPSSARWRELLDAAEGFHDALSGVEKPEFIDRRQDRWRIADRVAWGELPWREFGANSHVTRLVAARLPLALKSQLVHCDLAGNVLFADHAPPGIIDLSLYWRPAGYSAAVVVGDAIAWEGAEPALTKLLTRFDGWRQLLLRAVLFRIVTSELARRAEPSRGDLSEGYREVVELAVSLAERE